MPHLDRLLAPRSIAIVGLSDDPSKHGGRVLQSLRKLGYAGDIWGVNPREPRVPDIEMFAALEDLPDVPDLVVSAVPARATAEIAAAAATSGAGAMVVFAGGYAEAGPDGSDAQTELKRIGEHSGMRLLGPNSGGVIRPDAGLAVSFLTCLDRPAEEIRSGPVGLVTQSGGTGSYIHNLAAERGSGLGISISTGNEVDIDISDGISALTEMDEIRVIALVMETVRDGGGFVEAIQEAHLAGKHVVACRLGVSDHGRAMTATHTGAMARPGAVLHGVLSALGVTLVETPGELLDVAEVMARADRPTGDRIGIVTHSGGMAILLTDLAERHELKLPPPSRPTADSLTDLLDHGTATNPLDMGGIIGGPSRFADVVAAFESSGDFDAVLAVSTAHPRAHTLERVRALIERESSAIHLWMAGDIGAVGLDALRLAGLPVTTEPRAAIKALAALTSGRVKPLDVHDSRLGVPVAAATNETVAKATVARWGVEVPEGGLARSPDEALEIAARLGGRVAVKVSSADITHKTDAGGVELDVAAPDAGEAFTAVTSRATASRPNAVVAGAIVEHQVRGFEVIVGGVTDPTFGAMLLVGIGGLAAESFEPAMSLIPTFIEHAHDLISRAPGLRSALDRIDLAAAPALARDLLTLSAGFVDSPILEFEINPLTWAGDRWIAVDALTIPVASTSITEAMEPTR